MSQDIQQAWNEIKDKLDMSNVTNNVSVIEKKVQEKIGDLREAFFSACCDDWLKSEAETPADFSDLPPPPCTLDQARNDPNFVADAACKEGDGCGLHTPDAFHCIRSRRPT